MPKPRRVRRLLGTVPRSVASVRAAETPQETQTPPHGIGFTGTPVKSQPVSEPRRVAFGFAPGQDTAQITIAR
jgi:hypothetical protein